MKNIRLLTIFAGMILLLTGCGTGMPDGGGEYRKLTPQEAKQMLEESEAILLDVRTMEEYEENHIEGAVLIPDYEIKEKAAEMLPEKDALILVYCRSGNRSRTAAKELVEMGYTNVYDFGGIIDWPY